MSNNDGACGGKAHRQPPGLPPENGDGHTHHDPLAAPAPSSTDREIQLRNAAEFGDVAAIDALIHAGVDPNASNHADNTALHYAAWRGRTGTIKALLAAGADPLARNSYGATPLDIAVRERHREAAEVLGYSSA